MTLRLLNMPLIGFCTAHGVNLSTSCVRHRLAHSIARMNTLVLPCIQKQNYRPSPHPSYLLRQLVSPPSDVTFSLLLFTTSEVRHLCCLYVGVTESS